jgi:hypothetical protein
LFLKKSSRLDPQKFHVIPNGFDEPDFAGHSMPDAGKFVFTYVGTMSSAYNPKVLFDAIEKLAKKHGDVNMELRMVGTHAGAVKNLLEASHLSALTTFIPQVEHARAVEYMQRSNILLLVIPDVENSEGILTGNYSNTSAAAGPSQDWDRFPVMPPASLPNAKPGKCSTGSNPLNFNNTLRACWKDGKKERIRPIRTRRIINIQERNLPGSWLRIFEGGRVEELKSSKFKSSKVQEFKSLKV